MKKFILRLLILSFLFPVSYNHTQANTNPISLGEAFIFLANEVDDNIPTSYSFISLNYRESLDESLKDALRKLVYLGKIENKRTNFNFSRDITVDELIALSSRILEIDFEVRSRSREYVILSDLQALRGAYKKAINPKESVDSISNKQKIFLDVYNTLTELHYNADEFNEIDLLNEAIKGLTEGTNDTYTTYFPPSDSANFFTNLDGEYEGIGAYVEMQNPGELMIVSPISGSPAEKAGLEGGDIVIKIDNFTLTETTTLEQAISLIKGPKGSSVKLTIVREGISAPLVIEVVREKIVLKDIEYEITNGVAYVKLRNFSNSLADDFNEVINEIANDSQVIKIIFDVRNNPGGYLDVVSDMLSEFIPAQQATAIVGTKNGDYNYTSTGKNTININQYKIVLLQNAGSASASEIFVGTLKDYFPSVQIVGEQSFGKGSVQSLKNYNDGSTLKYTTAKWYTGKTRKTIDGVGIPVDIEVILSDDATVNTPSDNQLQKALDL